MLKPSQSEHITKLNNAGNNVSTNLEKRLRNKIEMLQRRNKNLTKRLGRCRRKIYRFKFLFETLRRQKYISDDQSASLQVGVGIGILK